MAQIDVTELFTDPDFIDPMTIVSRTTLVNDLGENELRSTAVATVGSIQPLSGEMMQRIPDALRGENLKTFWVKADITAHDCDEYPVLLKFKDKCFAVRHIFDWVNFGQGWCEGLCVAEKPSG